MTTDTTARLAELQTPEQLREMRGQLADCFPDEADDIAELPAAFRNRRGLYGLTAYYDRRDGSTSVSCDGACGLSSMLDIWQAIGGRHEYAGTDALVLTITPRLHRSMLESQAAREQVAS